MKNQNASKRGYKQTKLGLLPREWEVDNITKVAKISRGRFSPRPRNDPSYFGGDTPFVQTGDVSGAKVVIRSFSQTLNERGVKCSKVFPAGTILMTIAANIGDAAILGFDSACPDSIVGIQGHPQKINAYFLCEYLNKIKNYQRYLSPRSSQHNTNLEVISEYVIPLPPMAEQKKIAAILSTCDAAIEHLSELISAKKRRKKALIQQLVTGKKRLPGFSGNWKKCKIGTLFKEVSRPVDWDDSTEYSLLSVRRRSGGVFLREKLRGDQIATKVMFVACAGDFLISKMQVLHGATGLVSQELDGCHISGSYIALRPKASDLIDPEFFARLSEQHEFRHLTYLCSYGVHIEKMTFNLEWFLESLVLMPATLKEQQAIAQVLSTADREIALLERKHVALCQQKKGLMQKLLTGQIRVKP